MSAYEGYIPGETGGRTDNKEISVGNGAFVIPADVISGIGEGNSIAGAHALHKLFGMGGPVAKADGGATEAVPIVAASGEMVVPPDKVKEVGGGDMEHGHNVLDAFVMHMRKKNIRHLQRLPKPKKN